MSDRNIGASVRDRLLNKARAEKQDYNSALWSCELHQAVSFTSTATSLNMKSLLVEIQKIDNESIRLGASSSEFAIR